jgi:hypothetical protein
MAKSKENEIYQPTIWQSSVGVAINPDIVLENTQENFEVYEYLEIDDSIAKNLKIAKAFPHDFNYTVLGGNYADYCKDVIDKMDRSVVYDGAVNADFCGFSVLQTLFSGRDFDKPIEFKSKHFNFNPQGDLMNIYSRSVIETYNGDYRSFIVVRNNQTDNNFYGVGLCQVLYYLRELKKECLKNFDLSLKKYAVTPYVGLSKMIAGQEDAFKKAKAQASAALESVRSGGSAVINGLDNLIALTNNLSINDIMAAVKDLNTIITGLINGASDGIESGDKGSYARAFVQNEIVKMVQGRRLALIEKAMNTLCRWIVDIKFGTDKESPVFKFQTGNIPQFENLVKATELGIDTKRELWTPYIGEAPGALESTLSALVKPVAIAEFAEKKKPFLRICAKNP